MTGKDPPTVDRVLRGLARPPSLLEPTRGFAAVAAILDRNLDLLLIRRAEHPGDPWSGHLSFPGGRVEPDDPSPLAAARRETLEEVGLQLSGPLGQLDDQVTLGGRPGMVIRPFVFAVDDVRPTTTPNREVAEVLWRPLDHLLAGHGRTTMALEREGRSITLPCVEFDGHRLWGLTLMMLDGLLDRIDQRGTGLRRPSAPG